MSKNLPPIPNRPSLNHGKRHIPTLQILALQVPKVRIERNMIDIVRNLELLNRRRKLGIPFPPRPSDMGFGLVVSDADTTLRYTPRSAGMVVVVLDPAAAGEMVCPVPRYRIAGGERDIAAQCLSITLAAFTNYSVFPTVQALCMKGNKKRP